MSSGNGDVTRLLEAWNQGDLEARDALIPIVFEELKRIARRQLQRERQGHTLQPTALVHELYMKLVNQRRVQWQNRRDFFAVSSKLIRRILVDHARKRQAARRGGGEPRISFEEVLGLPDDQDPSILALDDALDDLGRTDPRGSRVVELHVFGGLTFDEIGEVIGVARSTVIRDWNHAKLWLRRALDPG